MKIRNLLVLAALLVASGLAQAQEFTRYHGKDTIQEGMGFAVLKYLPDEPVTPAVER